MPVDSGAPWPTFRGNAARNGLSDAPGLRNPSVAWSVRLAADAVGDPVVDREGRVYVATSNRLLTAIDDGQVVWTAELPDDPDGGPDVLPGGLLRVALKGGRTAAYRKDGSLERIEGGRTLWTAAAQVPGRGFFFVSSRWLRCSALPGWGLTLDTEPAGPPAADADGNVLVATASGRIYAASQGGALEWSLELPVRLTTAPAVLPGGGAVVGALDGSLYCVRSGEALWRQQLHGALRASPAVSRDGVVYAAAGDGCLYGFDWRGTALWKQCLGNEVSSGPAVDSAGRLYVITVARKLLCLAGR